MANKLVGEVIKDYFSLLKNVIDNQNNLGMDMQSAKDDVEVSQKLDKYFLQTTELINVHRQKLAGLVVKLSAPEEPTNNKSNLIIS